MYISIVDDGLDRLMILPDLDLGMPCKTVFIVYHNNINPSKIRFFYGFIVYMQLCTFVYFRFICVIVQQCCYHGL